MLRIADVRDTDDRVTDSCADAKMSNFREVNITVSTTSCLGSRRILQVLRVTVRRGQ